MTSSDILLGPRAKVKRAIHHINDLSKSVGPAPQRSSDLFVSDDQSQIGSQRFRARIPIEWSLIIGDCVHNLRSALDHLIYQAVLINDAVPDHETGFPIFSKSDSLPTGPIRKIQGASEDVRNIINRLNPCKGGNDNLCLLHDLDIAEKHKTLTVIWAEIGDSIKLYRIAEGIMLELASADIGGLVLGPDDDIVMSDFVSAGAQHNYIEASVQIIFGEGPAKGQAVIPTLLKLVQVTDDVIEIFGREVF